MDFQTFDTDNSKKELKNILNDFKQRKISGEQAINEIYEYFNINPNFTPQIIEPTNIAGTTILTKDPQNKPMIQFQGNPEYWGSKNIRSDLEKAFTKEKGRIEKEKREERDQKIRELYLQYTRNENLSQDEALNKIREELKDKYDIPTDEVMKKIIYSIKPN
jgi:NADPH-dependent 7-cyano-7-deazaguanine reductase QueF